MSLLQNSNAISSGGYQISNSLRFQSASSQYLSRTPASATNQTTWTWSAWVKRGSLGTQQILFEQYTDANNFAIICFDSVVVDAFKFRVYQSSAVAAEIVTTQVFRDPSAWYHIVLSVDTTQATSSNRIKLYVNGVQVTALGTATYPTQNATLRINSASTHRIGTFDTSTLFFDGYQIEIVLVDGQALTPSSFGETNTLTGQWVAKKYTGTYGTNGFYLPFSNGTSTTTLGSDSSGNGNNWTLTNFTRSAGTSDCWMKDVPSGNGGASATQPNSNYGTFSPLQNPATGGGSNAFSLGNLRYAQLTFGYWSCAGGNFTITPNSGKFYFEGIAGTTGGFDAQIGVYDWGTAGSKYTHAIPSQSAYGYVYVTNGQKYNNNSGSAYGASWTTGDVIGVAIDASSSTTSITFYKNGVSQGVAFSGLTGSYIMVVGCASNTYVDYNGGQRSFAYTPPSGYKALCTANLPTSTIVKGNKYMDATTYTGNGGSLSITNAGSFKPDLVWIKRRNTAADHVLDDSVRGAGKGLFSNLTNAENASMGGFLSFDSAGWSMNGTVAEINQNASTYVGWQWQAGQGTTSSNTNGSITSTVSVNATAGFSIATFSSAVSGAQTVGHGLGVAPKMIIVKERDSGSNWSVYHTSIGAGSYILLNTTAASVASTTRWNNTSPTSTVFSLGTDFNSATATWVAYCFAAIPGFSAFGSYTGNGSADGPFVYCGFRPKFVMIKRSSNVADWFIYDSVRNTYNVCNLYLCPNVSVAEGTATSFDLVSNGFKLRDSLASFNSNGDTFIFAAFAESPFASSNAR